MKKNAYIVIFPTNWAPIWNLLFETDFKNFPLCSQLEIFKLQEEGNPMKLHSEASVWRQWKHWIWMRQDVNKITEHVMKFPFRLQIRKPLCHICWLLPPPQPSPPPQHTADVTTVPLIRYLGFIRCLKHIFIWSA